MPPFRSVGPADWIATAGRTLRLRARLRVPLLTCDRGGEDVGVPRAWSGDRCHAGGGGDWIVGIWGVQDGGGFPTFQTGLVVSM